MEKRKPHYSLADIKSAFSNPDHLNRTFSAKQGADDLQMDVVDVVNVIQGLTRADFEKSMTSYHDHRVWHDVYRPKVDDRTIYLKFTVDAQQTYLLISFKEA